MSNDLQPTSDKPASKYLNERGWASGELVPVPEKGSVVAPDLLSQWLGGDSQSLGFLKCTYDLSTFEGVARASRFAGDSVHDNDKIDGQEFFATGIAISSWQQTDEKTGEVSIRPRLCIGLRDGSHLAFTGLIALRSGLFLLAGIKPEQWTAGVKIRVLKVSVKRGNDGHRFEILG